MYGSAAQMTVPAKDARKTMQLMGVDPSTATLSYLVPRPGASVLGTKRSYQEVGVHDDASEYDQSTTAPV